MKTREIGNLGEDKAADFLRKNNHQILDRNWRNKWCEIDIVSQKDKIIYFNEVKYRKSDIFGDGFDAITPIKMNKMILAANYWVNCKSWNGDYRLSVISVSPNEIEYLEL